LRPSRISVLDAGAHTVLARTDGFWRDERLQSAYTLGIIVWPVANALPNLSHTGGWDWTQSSARGGPIDENSGTLFVFANDGIAWFVSFDPLDRAEESRIREALVQAMWRARRAVTIWPSKDLFSKHRVQ
jgi:hypothetical protein